MMSRSNYSLGNAGRDYIKKLFKERKITLIERAELLQMLSEAEHQANSTHPQKSNSKKGNQHHER